MGVVIDHSIKKYDRINISIVVDVNLMYIFLFFLAGLSIVLVFVKEIPQLGFALIKDADKDATDEGHH